MHDGVHFGVQLVKLLVDGLLLLDVVGVGHEHRGHSHVDPFGSLQLLLQRVVKFADLRQTLVQLVLLQLLRSEVHVHVAHLISLFLSDLVFVVFIG